MSDELIALAKTFRVIASGSAMFRVSNGVIVAPSMLVRAAEAIEELRRPAAAGDCAQCHSQPADRIFLDETRNSHICADCWASNRDAEMGYHAAGEQKPVVYQYLVDGEWKECSEFVAKGWSGKLLPDTRPLYAAPQPAPSTSDAKLIDPIESVGMRGARKQAEQNCASMIPSTSDAGGGVRESVAQRLACAHSAHALTAYRAGAGPAVEYWNKLADAALSNPAAADSNASAEARLRGALEVIRNWDDYEADMTSGLPGRIRAIAETALSPDRRASDCEKQDGECLYCKGTGENLANPMNSGACNECGGTGAHPSDRTADVTAEDLARFITGTNVDFGGWEAELAEDLLSSFTVRRR